MQFSAKDEFGTGKYKVNFHYKIFFIKLQFNKETAFIEINVVLKYI